MAAGKARSFRVSESETNQVMIGAQSGSGKEVELMEAIPREKQLTVTFSNISGWVPIMHKAEPPMQRMKNMFTSKQEVHEATKTQKKQVRFVNMYVSKHGDVAYVICMHLANRFLICVDYVQSGWCMPSWRGACTHGAFWVQ